MKKMIVICLILFSSLSVQATLRIDITQGNVDPLPIAMMTLKGYNDTMRDIGEKITSVVIADLERSGLFRAIDKARFIDNVSQPHIRPQFGDWRIINAQILITGEITQIQDGRINIEFRLWDVIAEKQMTGLQLIAKPNNWRWISHLIADAVYERLTGEAGYFDSRIVYVDETGPKHARKKRLAIMDQDGHNPQIITHGKTLSLTPRFSPTAQEITYLSYANDVPRVYLLNIETGQEELVGDFLGMTFSPRFSPDGNQIIMSLEQDGHSNIYTLDLRNHVTKKLTSTLAIDTAPCYAPSGEQVVFESDRAGSQQLYVMDADGQNIQRISYGEGQYATPVWSPRGDWIAFTKQSKGRFLIGVMRPDGSAERILTEGYHNEGPTWSPNGRVLAFFRESKDQEGPSLWTVDVTGYNEKRLVTPHFASDPAWSPLIR